LCEHFGIARRYLIGTVVLEASSDEELRRWMQFQANKRRLKVRTEIPANISLNRNTLYIESVPDDFDATNPYSQSTFDVIS
jgi:hypothetical protein